MFVFWVVRLVSYTLRPIKRLRELSVDPPIHPKPTMAAPAAAPDDGTGLGVRPAAATEPDSDAEEAEAANPSP